MKKTGYTYKKEQGDSPYDNVTSTGHVCFIVLFDSSLAKHTCLQVCRFDNTMQRDDSGFNKIESVNRGHHRRGTHTYTWETSRFVCAVHFYLVKLCIKLRNPSKS